jgi:hypothetical protein
LNPSPPEAADDAARAQVLTAIATLDLDSADGWAGLTTALMEIERLNPGALQRLRADLQLRRLRREGLEPH